MPSISQRGLLVSGVCLLFIGWNFGISVLIKWAMSPKGANYPYPIFQAIIDSVIGVIYTVVSLRVVKQKSVHLSDFRTHWVGLSLISITYMGSIVMNNLSLVSISLPVNQIVKGCNPVPIIIFTCLLKGRTPSLHALAAVGVLVAGTCVAIPFGNDDTGHPKVDPSGFLCVLTSLLATAGRQSLSQYLLQATSGKRFDPSELLFWQSLISAPVLLVMWVANLGGERTGIIDYWGHRFGDALGLTLAISMLAVFYSIIMFWYTQLTSALTVSIAGSVKMVVVIVVPALIDPSTFSVLNWIGVSLFFAGLFAYSAVSYQESTREKAKAGGGTQGLPAETTLLAKDGEAGGQKQCWRIC